MSDSVLALLHFDDSNNPYKDECNNIWTAVGNPLINTNVVRYNTGSLYLDGSSYLLTSYIIPKDISFTVDFWTNIVANVNHGGVVLIADSSHNLSTGAGKLLYNCRLYTNCFRFLYQNSYIPNTNKDSYYTGHMYSISLNTWYHVAMVYDSVNKKIYNFVNGTNIETFDGSFTSLDGTGMNLKVIIGRSYSYTSGATGANMKGYIDEFCVSACAKWISNFTPPKSPYVVDESNKPKDEPSDKNYSVLLHFDDSDDVTKDECGTSFNIVNTNYSITSNNAKFGKALLTNGNEILNTRLYMPADDFTIDLWLNVHSYGTNTEVFSLISDNYNTSGRKCSIVLFCYNNTLRCCFPDSEDTYYVGGSASLSKNVMNHYAITYIHDTHTTYYFQNGNLLKAYSDGNRYGLPVFQADFYTLKIGGSGTNCTIDEFRIVLGTAVWTSSFVPPSMPY